MTDQVVAAHIVTLQIPEHLYERFQQASQASERPIEQMLVESLNLMFGADDTLTFDNLDTARDEQLWAVVYRPLAWSVDIRLKATNDDNNEHPEPLLDEERDDLIKQVDEFVLLRSKALLLLKQRGYDMDTFLQLANR